MNSYQPEIELYFELKGVPDSTKESYTRKSGEHIQVKTIKNTIIKIRNELNLDQRISAHTLRHCFATHCLENGVELALIQ